MIAILGGDGAGKTTALQGLYGWLSKTFETRVVHMGKPAWSPLTVTVRSLLKVGQMLGLYPLEASFEATIEQKSRVSPGYPYLIREVLRARDRYTTYLRARRFAARGGLVQGKGRGVVHDGPHCRQARRSCEMQTGALPMTGIHGPGGRA